MKYPIGSIIKVRENGSFFTGVVAGYFSNRREKYVYLRVEFSKKSKKYVVSKSPNGESYPLLSSDGENLSELINVWPVSRDGMKYLLASAGSDAELLWRTMEDKAG